VTDCPGVPHPDKVVELYLLSWSQDVTRYNWYSYDNPTWGQLGSGTTLSFAGFAFQQVYSWMVGSTMTAPCSASGTVWTCGLTLENGNAAEAIWNTAGTSTYTLPTDVYSIP
jgi:hypothetical protein